ncbi:hypothetical protein BH11MYX1_BH11MYX1_11590 [soil metagenome]
MVGPAVSAVTSRCSWLVSGIGNVYRAGIRISYSKL